MPAFNLVSPKLVRGETRWAMMRMQNGRRIAALSWEDAGTVALLTNIVDPRSTTQTDTSKLPLYHIPIDTERKQRRTNRKKDAKGAAAGKMRFLRYSKLCRRVIHEPSSTRGSRAKKSGILIIPTAIVVSPLCEKF